VNGKRGEANWDRQQIERTIASPCSSESRDTNGCMAHFPEIIRNNLLIAPGFESHGSMFISFAPAFDERGTLNRLRRPLHPDCRG